jgi:hypothetical protein
MKLIAHRGLTNGPDVNLENRPDQIERALSQGFDCEIDLRIMDGKFWLGHDDPQYVVDQDFLHQPGLWVHAKNLDALHWLISTQLCYFWHQEDDFALTSNGLIWTYPGRPLTAHSIAVLPEWQDAELNNIDTNCYGVCSDFVALIRNTL